MNNIYNLDKAILQYQKRRKSRLNKRGIRVDSRDTRFDANARLAYGIANGMGIDTSDMEPQDVWEAIKEKDAGKYNQLRGGSKKGKAGSEGSKKAKNEAFVDSYKTSSGATFPKPKNGAKLDSGTLKEVERLAKEGGREKELHDLISNLKESDYVYMKDPSTGDTIAAVPGISQVIDTKVKGRSAECQKIYDSKIEKGHRITNDIIEMAKSNGFLLSGLENCYKGGASTSGKVDRKRDKDNAEGKPKKSDEEYIRGFGDVVRYTAMSDHAKTAETVENMISSFEKKGYKTTSIDNKWIDGDGTYKAIHLEFESPDGERFEVQVHSAESVKVKNKSHPYYEKGRVLPKGSKEAEEYMQKSKDCWNEIDVPKGIERIKSTKK